MAVFLMFIVVGIVIPGAFKDSNEFIGTYAIKQGLSFGAGLIIMLHGVRMLINQIMPAFQGISEKLCQMHYLLLTVQYYLIINQMLY